METDVRTFSGRGPWPVDDPAHVRRRDIGRLLLTCPDHPGIVAAVSDFIFVNGASMHWGELRADIKVIISNHPEPTATAARWGLPFHHVPVARECKSEAEPTLLALLDGQVDLVILAPYTQIFSPIVFA